MSDKIDFKELELTTTQTEHHDHTQTENHETLENTMVSLKLRPKKRTCRSTFNQVLKKLNFLTFMKLPLQVFHENERFYKNKKLFCLSLAAMFLIGSWSFLVISEFGSIKSMISYDVKTDELPLADHNGKFKFYIFFHPSATEFCDEFNKEGLKVYIRSKVQNVQLFMKCTYKQTIFTYKAAFLELS